MCAVSCGTGLSNCAGTCRDLATDNNNCGTCGRACPSGQICSGGGCSTGGRSTSRWALLAIPLALAALLSRPVPWAALAAQTGSARAPPVWHRKPSPYNSSIF